MLIGLLHDRLDKRLARFSSKFEESGGFVTQPHGDVTRARPCKIADQECTQKNAPVSRGVFALSQCRLKS
jgi:hypothetical protein